MTLVPDFRLVKIIGRGSHTFLTKIQNRKSRWPCNPNCARICSDHQTVSAVVLAWWWELHDTCFATLDFVFPAPGIWSIVAALYTIHRLPLGASVTVEARLQAGWPRMHCLISGRGKSFFLSVPESCEIDFGSQWLLVALFPKLRRPGRGADRISVCRGFKNACVWDYTFACMACTSTAVPLTYTTCVSI
jgi:hypothetical protein